MGREVVTTLNHDFTPSPQIIEQKLNHYKMVTYRTTGPSSTIARTTSESLMVNDQITNHKIKISKKEPAKRTIAIKKNIAHL
jgi:hypothetical protein